MIASPFQRRKSPTGGALRADNLPENVTTFLRNTVEGKRYCRDFARRACKRPETCKLEHASLAEIKAKMATPYKGGQTAG